jgi:hypothetical protein
MRATSLTTFIFVLYLLLKEHASAEDCRAKARQLRIDQSWLHAALTSSNPLDIQLLNWNRLEQIQLKAFVTVERAG